MTPANPIATVGLMLTLAGLVGSFFNLQLSQWLRDLIALEQKAQVNQRQGTPEQAKAIVECRIEVEKLARSETYIINGLVLFFVVFVLVNGLAMARLAYTDPLYPYVATALVFFLVFFVGLSAWLFLRGAAMAKTIRGYLAAKPAA